MNRSVISGLLGAVVCTLISLHGIAQADNALAGNQVKGMGDPVSNTIHMLGVSTAKGAGTSITAANVNNRIQKSFAKSFGTVNNVAWRQLSNRSYVAAFDKDGRKTHALFYNSGFMEYAVSHGGETSLPKDIRKIIRANYVDYNIGSATEVKVQDKTAWVVNLASGDDMVIARVVDGYIDALSTFQTKPPIKKRKGKVIVPNHKEH